MTAEPDPKAAPPAPPVVRGVLFDATGTLIELARSVGEVYSEAAAEQDVALSPARVQDGFDRVMKRAAPRVYPGHADLEIIAAEERAWWGDLVRQTFQAVDSTVRFPDAEGLQDGLFEHFARAEAWRCRPGAEAMLDRLAEDGVRAGVVSNFDLRLGPLLDELGLGSRLQCVVLPAHCHARKPDPAIFRAAVDALGLPIEAIAVVGDDPEKDLEGARAIGLHAIDVRRLESLTELPRALHDPATFAR